MGRSLMATVVVASMLASGCSPALSRVRVGFGPGGARLTMGAGTGTETTGTERERETERETGRQGGAPAREPAVDQAGRAGQAPSTAALHLAAARIPLGSKVKVKMRSGAEVKGTLREVGPSGIVVRKPAPKGGGKSAVKGPVKSAGGTKGVPAGEGKGVVKGAGGTKDVPAAGEPAGGAAVGGATASGAAAGEVVEIPYEAMRSVQRDTSMGTGQKIALITGLAAVAGLLAWRAGRTSPTKVVPPGGG